jgi:hypothetical protein
MLRGKNVFSKFNTAPLENPNSPDQPALHSAGLKRFGKKLYAITFALIAVVIIAIALLIPQGAASIPLNVNYTVGEKMIYNTAITGTFEVYNSTSPSMMGQPPNNVSVNAKQSIEVTDFDGEYYTLNHTTTMMLNDKPFSFSTLEKMNKTGYSAYIFNLGNTTQEIPNTSITSNSYLTQLLNKPEVKVGDSINVPSSMGLTGDLTITFRGIEDLTVPAGTYKVFRIDMTSNNLNMSFHPSIGNSSINVPTTINMNIDMNYQVYMEYGTMRLIKSTMQETVAHQSTYYSTTINYTMHLTMDMTLNQHIKP